MPITFRCSCGKKLRAPDGSEGKQTRCPVCQAVVPIPGPELGFAEGEVEEAGLGAPSPEDDEVLLCPNCHLQLEPDAALCINCGTRVREPLPEEGPRVVLPMKGMVIAGIVVVVALGFWFLAAAPFIASMRFGDAHAKLVNGDLEEAKAKFEEIAPKMGSKRRKLCELRARQIELEMKHNSGKVLADGKQVSSPILGLSVSSKGSRGGALLYEVAVTNKGEEPLKLSREYFYVRGASDIRFVANHELNTIDDVVVQPGKAETATIVFRDKPSFAANRKMGSRTEPSFYLMLNTGDQYVKSLWPF
jgi:hypothetical protein